MAQEFTPSELVEKYPQLEQIGFKKNVLGILLSVGLLKGTKNRSLKVSYIDPDSLESLLQYRSTIIDLQKVSIQSKN